MGSAQSAALDVGCAVRVARAAVGHSHMSGYLAQVDEFADGTRLCNRPEP